MGILQKGFVCGNNRGKCVSGDDLLHPYLKINHLFSCKRSCRNRLVYKNVIQNDIIITDFHVVLSLYAMTMRIVKTGALYLLLQLMFIFSASNFMLIYIIMYSKKIIVP